MFEFIMIFAKEAVAVLFKFEASRKFMLRIRYCNQSRMHYLKDTIEQRWLLAPNHLQHNAPMIKTMTSQQKLAMEASSIQITNHSMADNPPQICPAPEQHNVPFHANLQGMDDTIGSLELCNTHLHLPSKSNINWTQIYAMVENISTQ